MRVCLAVGMIMLGGFLSSDLAARSWAMNIVCVVRWWPLGSCLSFVVSATIAFCIDALSVWYG